MTPRPLHVVIFTPYGKGGKGGIDRLMDELRPAFLPGMRQDIKLHFIPTRGPGHLWFSPFYMLLALLRLAGLRATGRAGLAHINLAPRGSAYRKMIIARAARLLGVPYVIHLHGSTFRQFWDGASGLVSSALESFVTHARSTIVLGTVWADYIAHKAPRAKSRIVILANASRSSAATVDKHHTELVEVLFLGRLGARKGVPQLIKALALLDRGPHWHAILAGDGEIAETRAEIARLGLAERVDVPGWCNDTQTAALLLKAHIVVLPSFDENLPMSVIEGFANCAAVVTTPVGATCDIVQEGETGLLVGVGDVEGLAAAMMRLIRDADLRIALSRKARKLHDDRLEIGAYTEHLVGLWRAAASQAPDSKRN